MAEELINLNNPPRRVSLGTKLAELFGGFNNVFGWLFFSIGMLFTTIFFSNMDTGFLVFMMPSQETGGSIVRSEPTSFSEGGDKHGHNSKKIFAYYFEYTDAGAIKHKGKSFAIEGSCREQEVTVQYLSSNPAIARIKGCRMKPVSPFAFFIILFPVVGMLFIIRGMKKGIASIRLLGNGVVGKGRMISMNPTNERINNKPVYELIFEFKADSTIYKAKARTHKVEALTDEKEELLMYDPDEPGKAVLLDDLPSAVKTDTNGDIKLKHPLSFIPRMIIPCFSLIFILIFIVLKTR